jgi:hypothetical protein
MEDLDDPRQLYTMLQQWFKAFQTAPSENARPYYVTLAPISIANGPTPPNIADLELAQDIVISCAKQRSTILDNQNLLNYMAQNPLRYDFPKGVTRDTLIKASLGFEADLTLIGRVASRAINDPTKAISALDYSKEKNIPYPQGTLPDPMPTLKATGKTTQAALPNFVGLSLDKIDSIAQEAGVVIDEYVPGGPEDTNAGTSIQLMLTGGGDGGWNPHTKDQIIVKWQNTPPGTPISKGMVVLIAAELASGIPR